MNGPLFRHPDSSPLTKPQVISKYPYRGSYYCSRTRPGRLYNKTIWQMGKQRLPSVPQNPLVAVTQLMIYLQTPYHPHFTHYRRVLSCTMIGSLILVYSSGASCTHVAALHARPITCFIWFRVCIPPLPSFLGREGSPPSPRSSPSR